MPLGRAAIFPVLLLFGCTEEGNHPKPAVIVEYGYNWESYQAVFVSAPEELSASLRAAVKERCAIYESSENHPAEDIAWMNANGWSCDDGEFSYFRGLTGMGENLQMGYVCNGQTGTENQQYFAEFMLRDWAECVPVRWDDYTQEHYVVLPSDPFM